MIFVIAISTNAINTVSANAKNFLENFFFLSRFFPKYTKPCKFSAGHKIMTTFDNTFSPD